MPHIFDARGPVNSVDGNFLKCCKECYSFEYDERMVDACVSIFKVDVNAQVKRNNGIYRSYEGYTGLHFAVSNHNPELVKYLLRQPNIDVNKQTARGDTPILILVKNYDDDVFGEKDLEILQDLLKRPELDLNIDFFRYNEYYPTLAHHIVDNEYAIDLVKIFAKDPRMNWNEMNIKDATPIKMALDKNKKNIVEALLMIDSVDKSGIPSVLVESIEEIQNLKKRKRDEIPECPVCFNSFKKEQRIFQCSMGHFVCGSCKPRLEHCPECREPIIGRAHGFEKFLSTILENFEDIEDVEGVSSEDEDEDGDLFQLSDIEVEDD